MKKNKVEKEFYEKNKKDMLKYEIPTIKKYKKDAIEEPPRKDYNYISWNYFGFKRTGKHPIPGRMEIILLKEGENKNKYRGLFRPGAGWSFVTLMQIIKFVFRKKSMKKKIGLKVFC